ncbi:MAG: lipoyl(octanoyl) transferase LipB [Bacteroidota bacterium]
MQPVHFEDLRMMDYKTAWDYQEQLLRANVKAKTANGCQETPGVSREPSYLSSEIIGMSGETNEYPTPYASRLTPDDSRSTTHHLLFAEHPPVYTLGKSGKIENVLISDQDRQAKGIDFFYTNRGGDITFHGPQQIVGYPILDLEKFYTDIGRYLRNLEEVMIQTMAEYGLQGQRSAGETGVWLDPGVKGMERKIGAIGVRCSRWITMHGFAFNINTDLSYFDNIIPCGIQHKKVTSLAAELNHEVSFEEAKEKVKKNFEKVFDVKLV